MAKLCGGVLWLVEVWPWQDPWDAGNLEMSSTGGLSVLLSKAFPSSWGLVGTPGTNKFCLARGPPFVSGLGMILYTDPGRAGGFTEVTAVVLGALG